jgi:hypothetical protein
MKKRIKQKHRYILAEGAIFFGVNIDVACDYDTRSGAIGVIRDNLGKLIVGSNCKVRFAFYPANTEALAPRDSIPLDNQIRVHID